MHGGDIAVLLVGAARNARRDGALITLDGTLRHPSASTLGARSVELRIRGRLGALCPRGVTEFADAFTTAGLTCRPLPGAPQSSAGAVGRSIERTVRSDENVARRLRFRAGRRQHTRWRHPNCPERCGGTHGAG